MADPNEPEIAYETARDELIATVQKLETGGLGLDESLALWERGEHLAQICQQWLDGARARLDEASRRDDVTDQNDAADQNVEAATDHSSMGTVDQPAADSSEPVDNEAT